MKLRTLIFLAAFALGVIPILTLVAVNLADHIERHEQVSRQALAEFIEARYAGLRAALSSLTGTLDHLRYIPLLRESAAEPGNKDRNQTEALLHAWFDHDARIAAIILSRGERPFLTLVRHGGRLRRDDDFFCDSAAQTGMTVAGCRDRSYLLLTGDAGRLTVQILADIEAVFPGIGPFAIVDSQGDYLYRSRTPLPAREGLFTFQPFPGTDILNDFSVAASPAPSSSIPTVIDLDAYRSLWFLPLSDTSGPWLVLNADRRAAAAWKTNLVNNIAGIVAAFAICIFFIARFVAGWLDRLQKELLSGLRRTLQEGKTPHFSWRGPRELCELGDALNTLTGNFIKAQREKEAAERELAASENRFRGLADLAHDAILMLDNHGSIIFWNKAAERMFGYRAAEALGKPVYSLISPRLLSEGSGGSEDLSGPIQETLELTAENRQGTRIPIELSISEALIGDQFHSIWIIRNISDRKRAEEQARRQQEQLIEADRMISLGLLVSGVAHEINNPNSIALLNIPLLRRAWQSITPILEEYHRQHGDFIVAGLEYEEVRDHIPKVFDELEEAAGRIKNIVQDLKEYARRERADYRERVDVNDMVATAVRLTANSIHKATNHFQVHYAPDLPPVHGHRQRLEQVVINLIQNACEALRRPDESISIVTGYQAADNTVFIRVSDEGRGIAKGNLHRVTDPFFTTKRRAGGTGLGLSVSAGIVKHHGGILRFESEEGKGTQAWVMLPAYQPVENGLCAAQGCAAEFRRL